MKPAIPAALLAAVLAAGCGSTPAAPEGPPLTSASITEESTAEASVVAVDRATREITIERADGSRIVLVAGPDLANFDRIEAGGRVRARFTVNLAVRRLEPGEPDTPPSGEIAAARARLGEKPIGGVAAGLVLTVRVESVDRERHVVTFKDPDGALRTVQAGRDQGKHFVAGLSPGDRVEISYSAGVALSVE